MGGRKFWHSSQIWWESSGLAYLLTLGRPDNGSILARSMKIGTIVTSSTEAEWMALSHLVHGSSVCRRLSRRYWVRGRTTSRCFLHSDAARQIADQPNLKRRSRHISIRYRLISRSVRCWKHKLRTSQEFTTQLRTWKKKKKKKKGGCFFDPLRQRRRFSALWFFGNSHPTNP
jgi:hypothetical protein